jgi:hypothetical protein
MFMCIILDIIMVDRYIVMENMYIVTVDMCTYPMAQPIIIPHPLVAMYIAISPAEICMAIVVEQE